MPAMMAPIMVAADLWADREISTMALSGISRLSAVWPSRYNGTDKGERILSLHYIAAFIAIVAFNSYIAL